MAEPSTPHRRILISAPTPTLEKFKELVSRAVDLGGTHVVISDLPKSRWQWESDRSDPYPNWGMLRASFFKVIVPDELKAWLPSDFAERNREILQQRASILKENGLKALFIGIEPAWLPEEVYAANPDWRGPRVDQPRRSRKPYFSPCIDHPEVLAMYRRAVADLCQKIPIENFDLLTNDSGGGICWASNLYPGSNGPESCRHRSMSERIVTFLTCIQDGVRDAGLNPIVSLQYGAGQPETRAEVNATVLALKSGQILQGRMSDGKIGTVTMGDDQTYNIVYPCLGIPQTIRYAAQLSGLAENPEANLHLRFLAEEPKGTYEVIAWLHRTGRWSIEDRWAALAENACAEYGLPKADLFLELCQSVDQALAYLAIVFVEPLLLLGVVNQRLLTRPFVPFPRELTPEESDYWRKFQFQANDEDEADDLNNFQGFNAFKGYSGAFIASLNLNKVDEELSRAIGLCRNIIPLSSDSGCGELSLMQARLTVLRSLIRCARNAMKYQSILDQTDFSTPAPQRTQWPLDGDQRLRDLNAIARMEVDNCIELAALLDAHPQGQLLKQATREAPEDIFTLPEGLSSQLRLKVKIMIRHLNDAHRLYERRQG
jgi:hypothetical protein